uniref:Uncharacterized protein n=1 Tax=Arundo donax TaxID=35708 RepID=A0A0A9AGI7_ARUDO
MIVDILWAIKITVLPCIALSRAS